MTSFMGFIVVVLLIWMIVLLARSQRPKGKPIIVTAKPTVVYGSEPWAEHNKEIEQWINTNPDFDKKYWAKVAGTNHLNDDGSSRQAILSQCQPRDFLRLILEPDNPVDPDAVKVVRQDGKQIGYLPKRVAATMQTHFRNGEHWEAVLTEITGINPHPHPWQGANICLVRRKHTAA
jgi:hypothetical protein